MYFNDGIKHPLIYFCLDSYIIPPWPKNLIVTFLIDKLIPKGESIWGIHVHEYMYVAI